MFELNLIKDKALARQRRRVIFLGVVSILFLAGLLSIFVGSLFWAETTKLNTLNKAIADKQAEIDSVQAQIAVDEPQFRKRRNALIKAYNEDAKVLATRPYFNPILKDIASHHPETARFWYNSIQLTITGQTGPRAGGTADPSAFSKALMGPRGLEANGYIQIEASDIVTESELSQVARSMDGMRALVGEPKFNLSFETSIVPSGGAEGTRYVPFTLRAAQTTFSAETP